MRKTPYKDRNNNIVYDGSIIKINPDDNVWLDEVIWWEEEKKFELKRFAQCDLTPFIEEDKKFFKRMRESMTRLSKKSGDKKYIQSTKNLIKKEFSPTPEELLKRAKLSRAAIACQLHKLKGNFDVV